MGVKLKPSDYVHLHNHTHHSVLDGLTKIPELMSTVKDYGMHAVAITDHGTMSGAIEFYKAAKAQDIKPIIGIEAYVAARSRHDRDPAKDKARYHLTILAMNQTGYQNLMRLSSLAYLEGMYYKPRIDHELLEKYNEGLIIMSGCASGEIGENLRVDNYDEAKQIASWYRSVFGDRYYLELQDHGHPDSPAKWDEQVKINGHIEKLAEELGIGCVVTNDAHYVRHSDLNVHEILLCVGTAAFLSDKDRMSLKEFDLHVEDPAKIIERWGKTNPEAVLNTKRIADRCNLELELGKILIPIFPVPEGENEKSYLDKLVFRGLAVRYTDKSADDVSTLDVPALRKLLGKDVLERVDMELGVIDSMNYNGYFLIVQDFINWGKDQGIIFGPGRGSAAGSIVAYSLNITTIDPLKYGLMFERFLNPNRISMPDIDVDIQDTRRDEVIEYCADKYGKDRVANIVTFGTMAARASVRDVARVLQVPYAESDRLAKLIPPPVQGRHIPLEKSIVDDPDLRTEYENNATAKEVFDYAIRLEGTIRSHGVHAAGVVIAPDEVVKFAPVEISQKGSIATQYPMGPVEELGLLKMDFLGLSNLTIIKNALRTIKKVYDHDIELSDLPLDDAKTFELLQRGDTTGVFQLESAGMKRYLKELKPTQLEDIIAMVALYRPGPLAEIPRYITGKQDPEAVQYLHSSLEPILSPTYGVMVYQEQIILLLQMVAGYSAGEADLVRKAIGKKKRDIMAAEEPKFIDGCKKQGLTGQQAHKLWDQIQPFADYSFNKAHATCYAAIAYWTAYLKAHYPEAFMAALMTSDEGDTERLAIEISECKHMGIEVLAPDVNESFVEFAIVPNKPQIRFGMAAVKGVGTAAVEEVLRAREESKFKSIEDFATRVSISKFNKKAWESLIKSGGFDSLGDRSDLLFNLDTVQAFASKVQKEALSGQTDLFGLLGDDNQTRVTVSLQPAPVKHTERERLMWERELLGLYVSSHPLDAYSVFLEEQSVGLSTINADMDGKAVTVGGIITTLRMIVTKSGSKMAFLKLEDMLGELETVVFPNLYEQIGDQLEQDKIILVKGKVNAKDKEGNLRNEVSIIADEITILEADQLDGYKPTGQKMKGPKVSTKPKAAAAAVQSAPTTILEPIVEKLTKLYVHVKNPDDHESLKSLKQLCSLHPGAQPVILVLGEQKKSAIKLPFTVDANDNLMGELVKTLGEDFVVLK